MCIVKRVVSVTYVIAPIVRLIVVVNSKLRFSNVYSILMTLDESAEGFNCHELIGVDVDLLLVAFFVNEDGINVEAVDCIGEVLSSFNVVGVAAIRVVFMLIFIHCVMSWLITVSVVVRALDMMRWLVCWCRLVVG